MEEPPRENPPLFTGQQAWLPQPLSLLLHYNVVPSKRSLHLPPSLQHSFCSHLFSLPSAPLDGLRDPLPKRSSTCQSPTTKRGGFLMATKDVTRGHARWWHLSSISCKNDSQNGGLQYPFSIHYLFKCNFSIYFSKLIIALCDQRIAWDWYIMRCNIWMTLLILTMS